MFGWLRKTLVTWLAGKPASARQPVRGTARRQIRASYDSAATTEENARHWENADGLSAAAANSLSVRSELRNRSRYEYDNSGYCGGMIRGYANDLVGVGPSLQVQTDDDAANDTVEARWKEWGKAVGLGRVLWTAAQAKTREGEAFLVLRTNEALATPVKLDLELVEADRVTDPLSWRPGQDDTLDGITYGPDGRPVSYTILREHPSDVYRAWGAAHDIVPARYVVHWFRCDRAGQLRGIPELQSSLPLFSQGRRWGLATLTAAETAASFAAVLENEDMPADTTVSGEDAGRRTDPFSTMEIERGMLMELPGGAKMHQFEAKHPNTLHKEFKRGIVTEAGRPLQMPANVSTGDSSDYNFSSAKLDHYGYRGSLGVERAHADEAVLDALFLAWLAEAVLIPGYLPAGVGPAVKRAWFWPGWPSMDRDESSNDTERLNNGTTTLAEILAEWGIDWRAHLQQRAREVKLSRELGLTPAEAATLPGDSADTTADPTSDPAKPAGTAKQAAASGDVQATALNGAQIASLIALVDKLATKAYPAEAVEALVLAAFPLMDRDTIRTFIAALDRMPAPKPAPTPAPPGATDTEDDADGTGDETQATAAGNRLALNGHSGR